uniref:Putative secreted protein n=1 Tax=Ixodes ricinus TaxID=34613 RepID=A0A147BAG4_IXORI
MCRRRLLLVCVCFQGMPAQVSSFPRMRQVFVYRVGFLSLGHAEKQKFSNAADWASGRVGTLRQKRCKEPQRTANKKSIPRDSCRWCTVAGDSS